MLFLEAFSSKQNLLESHDYSCLMAKVPEEFNHIFARFQKFLPYEWIFVKGGDYGLELEPHVTVLYGILDKEPDKVKDLFKHERKFNIKLGNTTLFQQDDHDVLKLDVDSDHLHRLNKTIRDTVKYETKYPKYHPHLTVAYLRKGFGHNYIGDHFKDIEIPISELVFSSSNGKKTVIPLQD